jgi:hypothetical protein
MRKKKENDENKHRERALQVNIRKIKLRRRTGNGSRYVKVGGTENIRSVRGREHKDINKIGSQQQQS